MLWASNLCASSFPPWITDLHTLLLWVPGCGLLSHLRPGSVSWSLLPILIKTYFRLAATLEIQDQVNHHLATLTLHISNSSPAWEPSWKLQIDELFLFHTLKNFVLCRIHRNCAHTIICVVICFMSLSHYTIRCLRKKTWSVSFPAVPSAPTTVPGRE